LEGRRRSVQGVAAEDNPRQLRDRRCDEGVSSLDPLFLRGNIFTDRVAAVAVALLKNRHQQGALALFWFGWKWERGDDISYFGIFLENAIDKRRLADSGCLPKDRPCRHFL